jgi:hypothetical protein
MIIMKASFNKEIKNHELIIFKHKKKFKIFIIKNNKIYILFL